MFIVSFWLTEIIYYRPGEARVKISSKRRESFISKKNPKPKYFFAQGAYNEGNRHISLNRMCKNICLPISRTFISKVWSISYFFPFNDIDFQVNLTSNMAENENEDVEGDPGAKAAQAKRSSK